MSFKELVKELSGDLSFRILSQVHVEHGSEFMPSAYQIFPERYLAAHRDSTVLCVDYDMGTGKTLSASLALQRLLFDTAMIEKELRETDGPSSGLIGRLPRPYIIGNWSSVEAFEDEFMRPMFGIISEEEYAEIVTWRKSEDSVGYERLRNSYTKRIHQRVRMASYQKMFNRYFRNASQIAIKDEKYLQAALEKGEIVVDPTIVLELSDSILVVDEMQMLYSSHGWNTYGFLLDHIRQNPDIHNLTTILLSGTFINSSPVEMMYLYNLIRDKYTPRLSIDDFFEKELLGSQAYIYTPKKSKEEELVRLFDGKIVSYKVSPSKEFPTVEITGDLLKIGSKKFEWLRLIQCHSSKYQWEQYIASFDAIRKKKGGGGSSGDGSSSNDNNDEDEQFAVAVEEDEDDEMMAHDFAIPPREEWTNYGVEPVHGATEVFSGSWLRLENLQSRFGAIPAALISLMLKIIKDGSGEKVVAHHRKLERGGLLQYSEALKENGFTLFGENPRDNAICVICGKELALHASVTDFHDKRNEMQDDEPELLPPYILDARQKKPSPIAKKATITDHKFIAAAFALLTGRLSFVERQRIILVYNSSGNLLNHRIMCLLLSGVGERGITLKATNIGIALGVFPGLPSWRQFLSRIARHGTHSDLPPDKRWAKILTMVLSPPIGSKEQYSRDEFRYFFREMNDKTSTELWDKVRRRTPNCPFISPENRGAMRVDLKKRSDNSCAWSLGKDFDSDNFETFYQLLHISYIKKVIRDSWQISPIWSLSDLRELILSDSIRTVPHNMEYTSDEDMCEAIVDLCTNQECQLLSEGKDRDLRSLDPLAMKKSDLILFAGATSRRGPRALTVFSSPVAHHTISWQPIGRELLTQSEDEILAVVDRISDISGFREKTSLFDRIIGKSGMIPVLQKDFENEGPLFKLLRKAYGVVWDGDDESHILFASNRLKLLKSREKPTKGSEQKKDKYEPPLKPIGFIIGNEYHSFKHGTWTRVSLPIIDASGTDQWDICAIFSPGSAAVHGRWHARTKIRPKPLSVEDLRRVQSGMACLSLSPKLIRAYAKQLGIPTEGGKTERCALIEKALLERQLSSEGKKVRFIYTPFERPPAAKMQ